jgi:hypothetical protein
MSTLTVYDLSPDEASAACQRIRRAIKLPTSPMSVVERATAIVGGRLSYLNRVARARDMVEMARHMLAVEKGWLLSQIGLIEDCDDDVMDEVRPPFPRARAHTIRSLAVIVRPRTRSKNGARARGCCCRSLSSCASSRSGTSRRRLQRARRGWMH